jgi:myo-inositol-1-phosphate synthase
MAKIKVAIIGVGNCSSSLVQGCYYYKKAKEGEIIPGIMHARLGGYHISDIEFTFGIDIDKNKVGKDLAEAIYLILIKIRLEKIWLRQYILSQIILISFATSQNLMYL